MLQWLGKLLITIGIEKLTELVTKLVKRFKRKQEVTQAVEDYKEPPKDGKPESVETQRSRFRDFLDSTFRK